MIMDYLELRGYDREDLELMIPAVESDVLQILSKMLRDAHANVNK